MVVFLGFHIVTYDNNALINAHLRGGHGGRELKGVVFFPVKGKFDHISDNLFGFIGDEFDFLRLLTQTWIRGSNNFHKEYCNMKKLVNKGVGIRGGMGDRGKPGVWRRGLGRKEPGRDGCDWEI